MKLTLAIGCSLPILTLIVFSLNTSEATAQSQLPTTPLNVIYEVKVGGVDYMTTSSQSERNLFPSNGAIFYIPSNNISGTAPMYREYNSGIADHMDSPTPGESDYTTEGILGYPFTSSDAAPQLSQLLRVFNGQDHATVNLAESLSGYTATEGLPFWGMSRYLTATVSLLTLSAGGVTIQSNGVSGGVLWNWTWNGAEFIDNPDIDPNADFGREMQAAIFYDAPCLNNPSDTCSQNPTEAGDSFSGNSLLPEDRHGSPITSLENSGLTQISTSVPLEFIPQTWAGSNENPVIYTGVRIGKQITLNYQNLGAVAEYVTDATSPFALSGASIEIPSAYLVGTIGPQSEALNTFYVYDVGYGIFTNVTSCANSASPSAGTGYNFVDPSANASCPAFTQQQQ